MPQPYLGEIKIFAGTFAPQGWAFCEGQLLSIAQFEALFTLIGTTYGGDGQNTFALPDLRGRLPLHIGSGFVEGQTGGVESVTLSMQQMPVHSHPMSGSTNVSQDTSPSGKVVGQSGSGALLYIQDVTDSSMNALAVGPVGSGQPHSNFQRYLCVNFIISLFGSFPSAT